MDSRRTRILVVDDDPAALALITEVLADAGFDCLTAESGQQALRLLDADRNIAVVVSDVVMPELDGVRLGYSIRERFPDRPWLQVVFVTGHAEVELAVSALRLGAVDYLSKPVAPDDLVAGVGRALAASRAVLRSIKSSVAEPAGPPAKSTLDYLTSLRRIRQESPKLASLDEPSWTILLEAYRAELSGRRLSVSKLSALDDTSQTTAWRRIRAMEEAGLLVRDQDPQDARRSFVTLTEAASRAIAEFMARADALIAVPRRT